MINPQALTEESFLHYPAQARVFAMNNVAVMQKIPLPLLTIILAQIISYDMRFPAEQQSLVRQFNELKAMDSKSFDELMSPFASLKLDFDNSIDWVNQPRQFNEKLSASLWATHQIDSYRNAGLRYEDKLADVLNGNKPVAPRLVIVIVGNGVEKTDRVLFRKLRSHGVFFSAVDPAHAFNSLCDTVKERSKKYPEKYDHWYVEGGSRLDALSLEGNVAVMCYEDLVPIILKEFALVDNFTANASTQRMAGPEEVQSYMASLGPIDLDLTQRPGNALLHQFQASIFTSGAGTQIFSTTFVQWTTREVLRRAQPLTVLARFGTRQMAAPMNVMLHQNPLEQKKDPHGSLIDADIGAYYTWLNLTRIAGADQSRFLVWFEDKEQALAISPSLARGSTSSSKVSMKQILNWMD